ncbi:prealbumin-like fold domain-containing protein [Enterococcus sp. UD-01]|jgi:uncharacterized surface anchored protein|uniref:prealbumin-like fold domain-containing protein n=1 Tax=Enterococcus sp. UD-01 TaxID=3373911 RepID=UPI0038324A3F
MKNKKYILSLMFIGVTLLLGFFFISFTDTNKLRAQEAAATISDNIFQDVKIVVLEESNRVLTQEDYLKNDSEVKVSMTFKFTNKDYKAGDTFVTTLPEGLTYKEVVEGELSGTASYRIDPATRKLTLTMIQDVQSAEYKLELITRIKFDASLNSKQQMLFETQTVSNYVFHLYTSDSYKNVYGKTFDVDGNEARLMPVSGGKFAEMNINYKHVDLATNNLEITWSTRAIPSDWTDGYVNIDNDLSSYKFYTYETNINGEQLGEKKELKAGEDFTIIPKAEGAVQLKFNERFHEALEVSGGEMTFDYDDFNPISNGKSASLTLYMRFYIYPGDSNTNFLSISYYSIYFYVNTLGYLGLGSIQSDNNVKENERIVNTPIYINGTNQQLKKGDTFTLTNEGDPALVLIDTNLACEYDVTFDQYGSIVKGTERAITNWKITNDTFGKITLTYVGEDTTKTAGLTIYTGMDETITPAYKSRFTLSGNGYDTSGATNFVGNKHEVKNGGFNEAKSFNTWTATVNSLYQKVTKLTDTFGYGIKAGSLNNLRISSVKFGKNGARKDLEEGIDYEVIDKSNAFEIKFLTEVKEKLTITYDTEVDIATIDTTYARTMNTLTSTLCFASADEKEFPAIGYAYVPSYLYKNDPYLIGKNLSNSTYETEKIDEQPVNRVKLLINPGGGNLVNNEVVVNYKSLDVHVLEEAFTVNKVGQLAINDYEKLLLGTEIATKNEEYPEIIIEENQIRVKNKKLSQPIVISFILAKNNYYNTTSDYAKITQKNEGSELLEKRSSLNYRLKLANTFVVKTSPSYVNIAEGTFTIKKNGGSALIKGTSVNLGNFYPSDGMKEIPSLREVTDGDGKPLPANTVTISNNYSTWTLTINDDQLTNGLIVKMNWSFGTSGTKRRNSGGNASHPYIDYDNRTSTSGYITNYWPETSFDIDNSGANGGGTLIQKDMVITMLDSVTNQPVAGAVYEVYDKSGNLKETVTANDKGQIILKDYVVTDYTLKEIEAPDGYLSNKDYSGAGKEFTLTNTDDNKLTILYVKKGKIIVHFAYQDGTAIETAAPITVTGGNGTVVNLKEQTEVKKQLADLAAASTDYRFISFEKGQLTGTEEAAVIPYDSEEVYYKYEGLLSLTVPTLLNFERGFVSPFEQILSYDSTTDFEVAIRDNRQITSTSATQTAKTRGNLRLNANLSKEFTTTSNKVLKDARLIYQDGTKQVVLNGMGGEIVNNQQTVTDPTKKDFTFILNTAGNKSQGFKLEVPAKGTLADVYTGEVTWEIVQEP